MTATRAPPLFDSSSVFLPFKVYFIDYVVAVVLLFLPFIPLCPVPSFPLAFHPPSSPPWVVHKFFGFSTSYTILNLSLFILYLPFMRLIPCIFSPIFLPPLPADNSPCDLYFCESVPILVVCLVCFCCFFRFSY